MSTKKVYTFFEKVLTFFFYNVRIVTSLETLAKRFNFFIKTLHKHTH